MATMRWLKSGRPVFLTSPVARRDGEVQPTTAPTTAPITGTSGDRTNASDSRTNAAPERDGEER